MLDRILRDVEQDEFRDNVIVLEHFDVGDDWRRVLLPKHINDRLSRLCVDVVGQEDNPNSSRGHKSNRRSYFPFEDEGGEHLEYYLL